MNAIYLKKSYMLIAQKESDLNDQSESGRQLFFCNTGNMNSAGFRQKQIGFVINTSVYFNIENLVFWARFLHFERK
jgi:hypothetical protein